MVPRAVFVCVCTLSISSTLGSKSWALAQTIQQPAISPWPMHHHLHTDTSTSLHLISVHSLTRSLACPSGLAVFFFLFLIFWFCYHHHHCHHLRHPLAPVSRKIHQIINITIQILQSSNPLPTSYYSPATIPLTHLTSHTSHRKPQTCVFTPTQIPSSKVQPRITQPGSRSGCALRTAHCQSQSHDARGSRYPACACVGGLVSSSSLGT